MAFAASSLKSRAEQDLQGRSPAAVQKQCARRVRHLPTAQGRSAPSWTSYVGFRAERRRSFAGNRKPPQLSGSFGAPQGSGEWPRGAKPGRTSLISFVGVTLILLHRLNQQLYWLERALPKEQRYDYPIPDETEV